jgi:nitrite reductase (NADH) large subunit
MIMTTAAKAWRCAACGYVHRGSALPEYCPVCGADTELFETFEQEEDQTEKKAPAGRPRQWQCLLCNHVCDDPKPPDCCPVCGAEPECFEPVHIPEGPAGTPAGKRTIVIVGGGIAGVTAIESIVSHARDARVILLSREKALPYYRLNLTRYLAGDIRQEELPIHPETWYEKHRVELNLGVDVANIDAENTRVRLRQGDDIEYDALILAVGSHPYMPPIAGTELDGVTSVRTSSDVEALLEAVNFYEPCVCIGGGVLGIETAGALARRGNKVTLLESHEWLMPRQLNRTAAGLLQNHIENLGITLKKQARSVELIGKKRVKGVRLADGTIVPAGIVVITTGVRPNTALARQAGLEVNKGIVVDNHMRTSHGQVFAAGDVAEHNGIVYGVWGASLAQGAIAGMNAVGGDVIFGGLPRSNTLKVLDVDMLSIGQFEPEDGSYIVVDETRDGVLYHFVFRDGVMAGAILLGDTNAALAVRRAVENRIDFSGILRQSPSGTDIVEFLA